MTESLDSTTRVVADADVLAADLLVGGAAREALDHVRTHSWMTLVASEPLLDDARAVIETLTDESLARDWHECVKREVELVSHPPEDHPALASAYRGEAAHLLSFDDSLTGARANVTVNARLALSIRSPDAFARLFDAESVYESIYEEPYPGPDVELDG